MKILIRITLSACVLALCFFLLQSLFMQKYASDVYEGNLIGEYYGEIKDHDVLFVGDCEVYENISPVTLWEEYGITSFIRGGAQQLIWQSYYLMEEAFRYEKPKAVVFNVLAMQYNEPQNEAYNRLNLDAMRLSGLKLKAVKASMMENENMLSYLFPLLRYHDRWSGLKSEDLRYLFSRPQASVNGFMIRCDIKPVDFIPPANKLPDYRFGDNTYKYLDMMTELCKENGVPLVLIKAPLTYPHWYPEWDEQMVDYAAKNNLLYINFLDYISEIGLDDQTDSYDGGLHLNLYGAEKLSQYFGKILQEEYGLADRRSEADTAARWSEKAEDYYRVKEAQEAEFKEQGKVTTLLVKE